jgi:Flp pilus assembly protein TadD
MSNKDSHYKKAVKHYESGKFDEAIYWFTMAVSIDQNDADLFSERGVAHFHLGKLNEALADMNRARDIEPNNPYRYASRAYIRDAMGDVEGAVKDYQQAIFLDPDDAVAHNNLGMLEEKLGRHSKAKALYALADQLAGDDRGIQTSHATEALEQPKNIQSAINRERSSQTLWTEIRNVFSSKKAFTDFITFVRNGFK